VGLNIVDNDVLFNVYKRFLFCHVVYVYDTNTMLLCVTAIQATVWFATCTVPYHDRFFSYYLFLWKCDTEYTHSRCDTHTFEIGQDSQFTSIATSVAGQRLNLYLNKNGHITAVNVNISETRTNLRACWFLRATAGTAIARLSHRNSVRLSVRPSVRLSVCHTGGSGKNGAS